MDEIDVLGDAVGDLSGLEVVEICELLAKESFEILFSDSKGNALASQRKTSCSDKDRKKFADREANEI